LDVNGDSKITLEEIKVRTEFDTGLDGEVSDEEAKDHLGGKEEVELQQFIDDVWKNIKNVYKASGLPEEPLTPPDNQDPAKLPTPVDQGQQESLDEKDNGDPETEGEEEIEGDDVDDFDSDKYAKEGERTPKELDAEGDEMPPYDEATQKLIDDAEAIRKEFNEIDGKYRDVEALITNSDSFMELDFGPDAEWAPLRDKCFELTDAQYVYKLCMFDKTSQKDKNGHGETSLGNWQKWDGPEGELYSKQKYDKGQACWNGPERSTEVVLRCGIETQLIEATEPGRCEYRFILETPVACKDPSLIHDEHTEL
uniref:MRH domain-containing protein n=1 Tax=Plectus sambesii TaxID=2011161 RepID=A0A914XBQ0_9BILA